MRITPLLRLGALLALTGCFDDDDYDDTRARGDLGNGTFVYGCTNDTDTSCDAGETALPRAVAVGARFDLRFSVDSGPQPTVITPVTDSVRRVDDAFEVRAPGEFALLAVNGNSEVIDIKHLRAAEVDEIRVQRKTELASSSLRLNPNESTQLLALPYDRRGVKLGGALDYAWHSSDEDLLSVESLPALNRVRVRAGALSGKATLSVEVGGESYDVSVQIGDGKGAPDAGQLHDGGAAGDASDAPDAEWNDGEAGPNEAADAEVDAGSALDGDAGGAS